MGYQADEPEQLAGLVERAAGEGMRQSEIEFAAQVIPPELRGRGGCEWARFLAELEEGHLSARWRYQVA